MVVIKGLVAITMTLGMTSFVQAQSKSRAQTLDLAPSPITNFHQDSATLFRGARPEAEGVAWLHTQGVATIIDLEDDDAVVADEAAAAKAQGLRFLSFPMKSWSTPKDSQVNAIEAAINDPANQPVFVHCHHGENRTGVIMAVHRVESEGWTEEAAENEMMADGFSVGGRWALLPYLNKRLQH